MNASSLTTPSKKLGTVINSMDDRKKGAVYPRINVRLNKELQKALEEIKTEIGASSDSEVARRAIVMYHTLLMQKLDGNEPVIIMKNSKEDEIIPLFEKIEE